MSECACVRVRVFAFSAGVPSITELSVDNKIPKAFSNLFNHQPAGGVLSLNTDAEMSPPRPDQN